ncbi:MAG: hypothetical protein ACSLEZ_05750 [Thiobacillus sp.]
MIATPRPRLSPRKFHPSWILLALVVTIVVDGIVWIPAAVVKKTDRYERPATEQPAPGKTAVPAEEVPATPTRTGPKTIWVDLSTNIGIV